jgi:hypothetical protein
MLEPQNNSFVMYDEEFQRISAVIEKLLRESNAKVIFLVDKNGQLIASCGETEHLDTTSLASLTAGNIAATGGLAKLIGEKEFSIRGLSWWLFSTIAALSGLSDCASKKQVTN